MSEYQAKAEKLIGKMLPEEREEMKKIVTNLTNELMEKTQQLRMVEKELKDAVQRKKAKTDVLLGHVDLVMFSKPRIEDAKVQMFCADNVTTSQALQSVKTMKKDPQHEFMAAMFLRPRKGSYDILEGNSECVWHLFQSMDKALHAQSGDKEETAS